LDSTATSAPPPLDEIIVTADFRDAKITELPASVSVIDADQLRATTVEHFEEAIREVPNLNLSGEGSRALLPAARSRRARAIRRRAESVARIHRRRHRLLGARQHRH